MQYLKRLIKYITLEVLFHFADKSFIEIAKATLASEEKEEFSSIEKILKYSSEVT